MKSQNKNFLYNIVYQLLTFIIPFLTVPYISRVLGVNNVGIYSYTYSIVYLFMLVGMLGFNNYGSRVIASCKDDREKLSFMFSSIYTLQLVINFIAIVGYVFYLLFFCKDYMLIAIIQGLFLISICFDINWFFFGIEKFKLTIIRNLIVKGLSVVFVFLFVKTSNDLWKYTLIMSGATLLSQIYLILIVNKYVKFKLVNLVHIKKHIKDVLILFIPVIAFSIYRVMDKTMIGIFSNLNEVAYYEYAEKLMNIPTAIISALGTVMLPRMSYLYHKDDKEAEKTIEESMKLTIKMSTIMFLGILLVADEAVLVLFGNDFLKSIDILKILSVTIIASAFANVIRTHFLIPLKKDKIYVKSTIGAAIINLLLNLIFIKKIGALGACIGTIAAEFFVMLYQICCTFKNLDYFKYFKMFAYELAINLSLVCLAGLVCSFVNNIYIRLIFKIIIVLIIFLIINKKFILEDFFGKSNKND